MKILKLAVIALFLSGYFAFQMPLLESEAQTKSPTGVEEKVAEARTVADGLFQWVKGLLLEKIKDGNFAEAAEVCHKISLKLRNSLSRSSMCED